MKIFLSGSIGHGAWQNQLLQLAGTVDFVIASSNREASGLSESDSLEKQKCNHFHYHFVSGAFSQTDVATAEKDIRNFPLLTSVSFAFDDGNQEFTEAEERWIDNLREVAADCKAQEFISLEEFASFANNLGEREPKNTYDFFISYSRGESSALASAIFHGLESNGNCTWMDKFCIPAGVDYQENIDEGIARAKAVIFIITPQSVQSEYCLLELKVAEELGKRIIPVFQKITKEAEAHIPESVKKINWIYIDEDRKYRNGLTSIISVGSADATYLDAHTRWIQKAVEWRENKKHRDFLMGETELILSSAWLEEATSSERSPAPTDLQKEYIEQSREHVVRTQRIQNTLRRLIFVLFIVSGIAAVFAFVQRGEAVEARGEALEQAALARSEKEQAKKSEAEARDARDDAVRAQEEAVIQRNNAEIARQQAVDNENLAKEQEQQAQRSEEKAKQEADNAREARNAEEKQKEIATSNARKANFLYLQALSNSVAREAKEQFSQSINAAGAEVSKSPLDFVGSFFHHFHPNQLSQSVYDLQKLEENDQKSYNLYGSVLAVKQVDADLLLLLLMDGEVVVYSLDQGRSKPIAQNIRKLHSHPQMAMFLLESRSGDVVLALQSDLQAIARDDERSLQVQVILSGYNAEVPLDRLPWSGEQPNEIREKVTDIMSHSRDRDFQFYGFGDCSKSHGDETFEAHITAAIELKEGVFVVGDEYGSLWKMTSTENTRLPDIHDLAVVDMVLDHDDHVLYTASADGSVYAFPAHEQELTMSVRPVKIFETSSPEKWWIRSICIDASTNRLYIVGEQNRLEICEGYRNFPALSKSEMTNLVQEVDASVYNSILEEITREDLVDRIQNSDSNE